MPSDTTTNLDTDLDTDLARNAQHHDPDGTDRLLPAGAGIALAVLGGTALWAGLLTLFMG